MMWVPWREVEPGLTRSPLFRTLQRSSCLNLDISIILASCSPKVVHGSEMEKWLEGGEEAPAEIDVWGDKKPSFKSLKEILDFHASSDKKKKVTKGKRKQKNEPASNSEEVIVKGKGKEKAKPKKAGEGSKKRGGSRKSHQNDD